MPPSQANVITIVIAEMRLFDTAESESQTKSGSSGRTGLLRPSPLRTARKSFPSYGSSLSERLSDETRKRHEPQGDGGTPEHLEPETTYFEDGAVEL
jgi:hypothetical protein